MHRSPHARVDPRVVHWHVDRAVAHEVATAFLDASSRTDSEVVAAYTRLVRESDQLFRRLTAPGAPDRVEVVFTTCAAPYRDSDELIASVVEQRLLEVTTVAVDTAR